ncbi:MAG: hypothetical protein LBG24_10380 [Treponema sp.]|jgi:hypothetical protein|nr:hypothetical protein [Treponema sp.]
MKKITENKDMGIKGNEIKKQSINFDKWMAGAIQDIADKNGLTFTSVVIELLRQELAAMGYTMGIGRESVKEQSIKQDSRAEKREATG